MSARHKASSVPDEQSRYRTPIWAIEALIEHTGRLGSTLLDPGCGDGRLGAAALHHKAADFVVGIESDETLAGRAMRYLEPGLVVTADFLTWTPPVPGKFDAALINPPYPLATQFTQRALALTAGPVIVLQRLAWLASQTRLQFWQATPLAAIHVLPKRPAFDRFMNQRWVPQGTDQTDYAWFVFDPKNAASSKIILTHLSAT